MRGVAFLLASRHGKIDHHAVGNDSNFVYNAKGGPSIWGNLRIISNLDSAFWSTIRIHISCEMQMQANGVKSAASVS
jgi:hypothetical protein